MPSFYCNGERPGSIKDFGGDGLLPGYLPCDASPFDPNEFPALYDEIGHTFGTDGGSGFPLLPDSQRKSLFGYNPAESGTRPIGHTEGVESVALEEDHIIDHEHSNITVDNWNSGSHDHFNYREVGHNHLIYCEATVGGTQEAFDVQAFNSTGTYSDSWDWPHVDWDKIYQHGSGYVDTDHRHNVGAAYKYGGGSEPTYYDISNHRHPFDISGGTPSTAHNNWQAFFVVTKMIRY